MAVELQPGDPRKVGPYWLLGRLGGGGMGRVFLGRSPGGRLVAVKLVRAELAERADFRARFAREVAAARTVSGLFTAPVVDADLDGPVPWLATAYVAGPSLADAVTGHGPLPVTSVLALAAGLAEGLGAIHAAGMVHRDLKPSNVLLADDGPRIIDFGISRAAEASVLTRTGLVVGSPGFMSPEQAEGRDIGPASDVFSLGAVLTFAATGEGPFGTGSAATLLYRVVHTPPATDDLPAGLRPLVEQCLAKDPGQRPTTGQLLAELDAAHPAAGWLPAPIAQAFPLHAPPDPAPAGAAAADAPPARPVTEFAAAPSPPPPPDAPGGPPTVTAAPARTPDAAAAQPQPGGTGQPPRHLRRRRLVWALVTGGLVAVSVAAAVALANTMGAHPQQPAAGGAQATSPAAPEHRGMRMVGSMTVGGSVSGIALSPSGRYCYATQLNGQVSVIETKTGTLTATIPTAGGPIAVAVSPDGRRAYVSHWGSHDVTVVDTSTNTVITSVDVGSVQWGIAVAPHRAYVALRGSGTVAVIDTTTNTVTTRIRTSSSPTDNPVEVAVTADGRRVYATNRGSASVSVIDTATNTLAATIPVQAGPNGVAVTRDSHYVLATNEGSGTVSRITAATGQVTNIAVGGAPVTLVVSRDGGHAYVVSRGSRTVSDINIAEGILSATLNLGGDPGVIRLAPDGHHLYIANAGLNAITVLDTST